MAVGRCGAGAGLRLSPRHGAAAGPRVPLRSLPSADSSALFHKQEAGKVQAGDLALLQTQITAQCLLLLVFFFFLSSSCLLTPYPGEELFYQ